jgi:hypothetical protein
LFAFQKVFDVSHFEMFELGAVGLPLLVAGILYTVVASKYLLPSSTAIVSSSDNELELEHSRKFLVSVVVKTPEAIIPHIQGLDLVSVYRKQVMNVFLLCDDNNFITLTKQSASPRETKVIDINSVHSEDILYFYGSPKCIVELLNCADFSPATTCYDNLVDTHKSVYEAVLSPSSSLCGTSSRELKSNVSIDFAVIGMLFS